MKTIYPAILSVPPEDRQLKGKKRVDNLKKLARLALDVSARRSHMKLPELLKDERGAPISKNGIFWSITHKPSFVGGVAAFARIGIDIEKIKPVKSSLFKKLADDKEWALSTDQPETLFFRYWTSKESVLKAGGKGFTDLSNCRISRIIDSGCLIVEYREKKWVVEHTFFNGHIASVTKPVPCIHWIKIKGSV